MLHRLPGGPARRPARPFCFVLVLGLLAAACGDVRRPRELNTALSLAEHGRFAEAKKVLRGLRRLAGSRVIAQMIANTRHHLVRYEAAYRKADTALRAQLRGRTRPQVQLWAKRAARAADAAGDPYLAKAYRVRMGELDQLTEGLDRAVDRPSTRQLDAAKKRSEVDAGSSESEMVGPALEHFLQDIGGLVQRGDFRQAVEELRRMLPMAGGAKDRVRDELWRVEEEGRKRIASILKQAEVLERGGKGRKAWRFLRKEAENFPDTGSLAGLHAAARALDDRLSAPPVHRTPSFAELVEEGRRASGLPDADGADSGFNRRVRRVLAKEARAAFDRHDYAKAAASYRKAADLARGLHFEHEYRRLAADAELMALTIQALERAIARDPGKFREVDIGYGEKADLLAADDSGIRARIGKDIEVVPYHGVPDRALAPLLARAATTAEDYVGAAVLSHRALDDARAVDLLARAVRADPAVKPTADRLLAAIRGEDPGPGGYLFTGGKFVSSRAKARAELRAKLSKVFAEIWRKKDDAGRDAVWKKVLAEDARALEIAVQALTAKKHAIHDAVTKSSVVKSLAKLRDLRIELDKRRQHALDLIFDTVRYFYPYRPPAVSGEKAAEYARVQLDVDHRVAAVHEIWNAKSGIEVRLPAHVVKEVELYRWLTGKLRGLGANTDELDRSFQVLFAARRMNIRNVALDAKDRASLDEGDRIVAANEELFVQMLAAKAILPAEVELIRLTNAYRREMGHLPLRCDERLVRAAHGHCAEMSELGYFAHTSPTPGRRTPGDRMRNEGYPRGGGENLAINASAAGAVYAWQHSSGHHRNMLMAWYRDLGTGNAGRYWGQNFGSGDQQAARRR